MIYLEVIYLEMIYLEMIYLEMIYLEMIYLEMIYLSDACTPTPTPKHGFIPGRRGTKTAVVLQNKTNQTHTSPSFPQETNN